MTIEDVLDCQQKILETISANRKLILDTQARLEKMNAKQDKILANQEKLLALRSDPPLVEIFSIAPVETAKDSINPSASEGVGLCVKFTLDPSTDRFDEIDYNGKNEL